MPLLATPVMVRRTGGGGGELGITVYPAAFSVADGSGPGAKFGGLIGDAGTIVKIVIWSTAHVTSSRANIRYASPSAFSDLSGADAAAVDITPSSKPTLVNGGYFEDAVLTGYTTVPGQTSLAVDAGGYVAVDLETLVDADSVTVEVWVMA